ncbi:MAG: hypothetical protein ACREQ7_13060 [Candidatus Binatia bacterium]
MKTPQAPPYFLGFSLLIVSACSSRGITLVHPQSGATVECSGSGFGMGVGWVESYIGDCTKRNEQRGYIPLEKLTPEQRQELERRGLLPRV